jgi:hypothetical protein
MFFPPFPLAFVRKAPPHTSLPLFPSFYNHLHQNHLLGCLALTNLLIAGTCLDYAQNSYCSSGCHGSMARCRDSLAHRPAAVRGGGSSCQRDRSRLDDTSRGGGLCGPTYESPDSTPFSASSIQSRASLSRPGRAVISDEDLDPDRLCSSRV